MKSLLARLLHLHDNLVSKLRQTTHERWFGDWQNNQGKIEIDPDVVQRCGGFLMPQVIPDNPHAFAVKVESDLPNITVLRPTLWTSIGRAQRERIYFCDNGASMVAMHSIHDEVPELEIAALETTQLFSRRYLNELPI